ncbi:MAG: hypothetical protein M0Z95_22500 [Actinomycetota bacterium]|jgi:hypothetical protein|nr:hypothetical protein [Actinomycetota bacterium]
MAGRQLTARSVLPAVAACVVVALLVAACGSSGQALARQACTHVHRAYVLFGEGARATDAARAQADRSQSLAQLEAALPIAARATSADPQWNPLMTTLEESGFNTESHLFPALLAQCALADSQNEQAPVVAPNGATSAASSGRGSR